MPRRPAFTLVELLVVVAIIGVLVGMLFPALSRAFKQVKGVQCMNNLKQIATANRLYIEENNGTLVPLWIDQNAAGWSSWDYDAASFVVQTPVMLWWPDKLRLDEYAASANLYSCPELAVPATKAGGGSASATHALGIGMNYPEAGTLITASGFPLPVYSPARESQVQSPSRFATFADAAAISNTTEADPDLWQEVEGTGCVYWRVPSDDHSYPDGDSRSVPRHEGKVNTVFFDGHVQTMNNAAFRFDLPRTDAGVLWAKNNDGPWP